MSENVFGLWKRRFPCLKELRTHLEFSQKIIIATAVLENMARLWGEEDPEDEGEEDEDVGGGGDRDLTIVDQAPETVRLRGQIARDIMMENMAD